MVPYSGMQYDANKSFTPACNVAVSGEHLNSEKLLLMLLEGNITYETV